MKKFILLIFIFVCIQIHTLAIEGQSFAGIGTTLSCKDGIVKINSVLDNSPAKQAGLKKDDLIIEIDDEKISDLNTAVNKIRGIVGTNVKLLVKRSEQMNTYIISRGNIFISDYIEIGQKAYFYKKYLKYENGIYYFWTKELIGAWGKNYNYGYSNYSFSKKLYAIDIKNQKCALAKELAYDKEDNLLFSNDYSDNLNYEIVAPNTNGYLFYTIINTIDKGKLGQSKEKFNGYIEPKINNF